MPPSDEAVVEVEVDAILPHPGEPKDAAWQRRQQRLELRSSDWEYMAEGGRHVLFSYVPSSSDDATPLWDPKRKDNRQQQEDAVSWEPQQHWLMRWNKHDLMQAASLFHSGSVLLEQDARTRTTSSKSSHNSTTSRRSLLDHVRDLVVPALSPYVDVPVHSWTWTLVAATELSSSPSSQRSSVTPWCALAHALYTQAVNSGKIPAHRQRPGEWTLFHDKQEEEEEGRGGGNEPRNPPERTVTVDLLYDYRRPLWSSTLSHTTPQNSSLFSMSSCSTFWSVELKPKAGYRPYSPLIHPHHRIKYTASRFQLLQRQKQPQGSSSTRVPPPATTTTTTNWSRYDPQNLFSNNRAQIRQALDDLRDCPGNNLRIWRTIPNTNRSNVDNHSRAEDTPHALPLPLAPREEDPTSSHTPEDDDDISRVLAIVAEILVREPWLSKLLTLQELDWIDADGAILMYRHLLSLLTPPSVEEDASAAVERYAQQLMNQLVACDGNSDPERFPENTTHTSHPNLAQSLSSSFVPPPDDSSSWLEHNPPKLVKHCPIPFPHHLQQQQRPPLDSSSKSSSSTDTHGTRALLALLCLIQDSYDDNKSRQPSQQPQEQQQRDAKVLDQAYAECLEWIGQLGVAETVYLLQVWLFSLAMCDVSCFVRLHMFPATATATAATHCSNDDDNNDDDDVSGFRGGGFPGHESLQTNERPGWLYYAPPLTKNDTAPNGESSSTRTRTSTTRHDDNNKQGWWIAYSIKAIDCDAKPAHKLATRQAKEDLYKGLG